MIHQIWIASHFHNQRRIDFFKDTIQSINNQTIKPNKVIVSFSLQENLKNFKDEIINLKESCNFPLEILYEPSRLYQFEHIQKIYMKNTISNNLFISFCDDDDYLDKNFIE
jgi:hypothetical protein